jgi:hypothetical protein
MYKNILLLLIAVFAVVPANKTQASDNVSKSNEMQTSNHEASPAYQRALAETNEKIPMFENAELKVLFDPFYSNRKCQIAFMRFLDFNIRYAIYRACGHDCKKGMVDKTVNFLTFSIPAVILFASHYGLSRDGFNAFGQDVTNIYQTIAGK